jgi:hypothetical protein
MGLDIGQALREGASRTATKNGLILAVVFAGIALLTTVLLQTFSVAVFDSALSAFQSASPQELGLTQAEYDRTITDFESALEDVREMSPLAVGLSPGIATGGLLVLALLAEAVSIVAVRVFATAETDAIPGDLATDNIVFATLNGFVGKVVVWGLILLGLVFLVIPGLAFAVLFYFLRQEIALENKNFVQAMADSWRLTKGYRIEVFLLGVVLIVVSRLEDVSSGIVGLVSTTGGAVAAAAVGSLLSVFGAAVVTRAYVQINEEAESVAESEEKDPYDAALGPEDLTR